MLCNPREYKIKKYAPPASLTLFILLFIFDFNKSHFDAATSFSISIHLIHFFDGFFTFACRQVVTDHLSTARGYNRALFAFPEHPDEQRPQQHRTRLQ